jgi:outer membrane protein assembly factor BamB
MTSESVRGPVVADVTGDGRLDVVAASRDGRMLVLDAALGTAIRERDAGGEIRSRPVAAPGRIYVAVGDRIAALSVSGGELWSSAIAATATDPLLDDVDGDGTAELVVVDGVGVLRVFETASGRRIAWSSLGSRAGRGIVSADMDRDGARDLVLGLADGRVLVHSLRRGMLLWQAEVGGRIEGIPAAGDFDGDGRADVAVGTLEGGLIVLAGAG